MNRVNIHVFDGIDPDRHPSVGAAGGARFTVVASRDGEKVELPIELGRAHGNDPDMAVEEALHYYADCVGDWQSVEDGVGMDEVYGREDDPDPSDIGEDAYYRLLDERHAAHGADADAMSKVFGDLPYVALDEARQEWVASTLAEADVDARPRPLPTPPGL